MASNAGPIIPNEKPPIKMHQKAVRMEPTDWHGGRVTPLMKAETSGEVLDWCPAEVPTK